MDPDVIQLSEAQLTNVEALYEIALESNEANTVRRAIAALLETPGGIAYLTIHGLNV